jgi:hypothetical protein
MGLFDFLVGWLYKTEKETTYCEEIHSNCYLQKKEDETKCPKKYYDYCAFDETGIIYTKVLDRPKYWWWC